MAKYCMKELLGLLRWIVPNEIKAKSLCFLLRMKKHTAQRLLNGEIHWLDMDRWFRNAWEMKKKEDDIYGEFCEKILKGRQRDELSATELKQLRGCVEGYEEDLKERLERAGILRLQGICYSSDSPSPPDFEKLLIELVEAVLYLAEEYRGVSGKKCVLDFLSQNHGTK